MTRLKEALLLAIVLFAVALLAVFDIVPETVAQFAPLAMIPFIVRRRPACAGRLAGRGA